MRKYCFSINGEDFDGYENSIRDAIDECVVYNGLQVGDKFWIGEAHKIRLTADDVSAECILEDIANDMDLGEDNVLDTLSREDYKELSKIFARAINKYLKKIGRTDLGYHVENIKEYTMR